jgi:hypothetical protein
MANISYTGTTCIDEEIIFISNEGLLTGKTYQDYDLTCITIDFSGATEGEINKTFLYGPFDTCSGCTAPISAGTETIVCVIDCSGNTITVVPPHPTYLNEYGKAVVQLNMVELGGMNGLNS